jgi:hypothetical protein
MNMLSEPRPNVIDVGLKLLDRQIVDKDGKMSGKVDDLELTESPGVPTPYITAILAGPGAMARQLGGRFGRLMESLHNVLHPSEHPSPARIAFGVVRKIDNHVEITVSREDLDVTRVEDWVRDHIISKIPGAQHEA